MATIEQTLQNYSGQPWTHTLLLSVLKDYQRPDDKIYQLARKGIIQPVRRGLYIPGPALQTSRGPEPFLLANHIFGPSYVSMETALAHHGLIPERVFEIASATIHASRKFVTSAGTFTYTQLPLPYYAFGLRSEKLADGQYAMMATPEKALFDKIITTSGLLFRSKKAAREFLLENLRIDEEDLKRLDVQQMTGWVNESMKSKSLSMMIDAIKEL